MQNSELIETYYNLYFIFNDDDLLIDCLKELTGSKLTKSCIRINLEYLRLHNIEYELNYAYDLKMDDLKAFKVKCKARYQKHGYQTTWDDFL